MRGEIAPLAGVREELADVNLLVLAAGVRPFLNGDVEEDCRGWRPVGRLQRLLLLWPIAGCFARGAGRT